MRIVSLLPAATDVVRALGHGREVVGATHHCNPSEDLVAVPAVTVDGAATPDPHSPYSVDPGAIAALRPDVVLVRTTCDGCATSRSGPEPSGCSLPPGVAVHAYDPVGLTDVVEGVTALGDAIGDLREGLALSSHLGRRLAWLERAVFALRRRDVTVVGTPRSHAPDDPWVDDVVDAAGGTSVPGGATEVAVVALTEAAPSPPAPEAAAALGEWDDRGDVYALAAPYLSRPGPGLVYGAEALAWALHQPHPDLRPAGGVLWRRTAGGWADVCSGRPG